MNGEAKLIREAVLEAGAMARRFASAGARSWLKDGDSPVTEADLAIDRFLHDKLLGARPDYGWLSEESEDNPSRLARTRVWIVDPIDGTRAFVNGRPHYTISVALADAGRPIAAAVYNPALDELFEAEAGAGARLNGATIHASARQTLEGCKMLGAKDIFAHPAWAEPWPPMDISSRNSIAYRLALVASGAYDAALTLSRKHDWDLAAADLLITESGGRITGRFGETFRYNGASASQRGVIAAGPSLHAEIMSRVAALPPRP